MNKFFKITSFLSILFLILNLVGCESSDSAQKESKKETNTTEVTAKAENQTVQVKEQSSVEETKTAVASPETKDEQPAAVKTVSGQSSKPAPQSPETSKTTTNTTANKTNPTANKINMPSIASKNTGTTAAKT